jgi:hypothetical protein
VRELQRYALLARVSHSSVRSRAANPIDLALQIAELRCRSDSEVLALALEAKASTVRRRYRALLLSRAFQVRGVRVSEITPELPLKLSLPIADDKTRGVRRPSITHEAEPKYPDLARHLALECSGIILATVIDIDGIPGEFHLFKWCGYGFDEMAATAVRHWRFRPAADEDGRPVVFRTEER